MDDRLEPIIAILQRIGATIKVHGEQTANEAEAELQDLDGSEDLPPEKIEMLRLIADSRDGR